MLILDGSPAPIHALAFSPAGRLLAAGSRTGHVTVWDEGLTPYRVWNPSWDFPQAIHALSFRPGRDELLVGTSKEWFGLRGPRPADYQHYLPPKECFPVGVTGLEFLSGNLLVIGHGDRNRPGGGALEVWDVTREFRCEPRHIAPQGIRALATLPDRKLVAWAEWGRRLNVWDIAKPDRTFIPLAAEPTAVALHPDGTAVAVTDDRTLRVFDIANKRERLTLKGHTGKVTAIGYTPDGRTLATGSWDKTVRLWDAASGHCRATFDWPGGKVYALAVAPDGLRLAAAGETGQVVIIDLE